MADSNILMGVIGRPHGVRGLVHVHSFTADPAELASYSPLIDDRGGSWSLAWRSPGIAELRNAAGIVVADRTEAQKLVNLRLYAPRDRLPPTEPDEYYLADLEGLLAIGADGTAYGQVRAVHDYGAGAILEIAGPQGVMLIPFTAACVPVVDVPGGQLTVLPPDEVEVRELGAEPDDAMALPDAEMEQRP